MESRTGQQAGERETIRVQINYPLERVQEPVIYRLVADFELIPDIRRADMDSRAGGYLFVELTGPRQNLARALRWMEEYGLTIHAVGQDGQEWTL